MEGHHQHHPTHHHTQQRHIYTGEYFKVLFLRTVGNFLIFSSLFLIGKTFYQPVAEEVKFFANTYFEKKYVVASTDEESKTISRDFSSKAQPSGLAKFLNVQQLEVLTPTDPNFSLIIPKIGANARIIANVNAADEKIYLEALKHGIAHAEGTAFPGEGGHIVLFAHSTDYIWNVSTYNAVFYLLYKLEAGDEVDVFFKGQKYVYKVEDKTIVDPTQVEYITRKTNEEMITLQTCWPPGTTLQRLLVFAKRVAK